MRKHTHQPSLFPRIYHPLVISEGGFTLVEELVTVAVIGLGLVILISMITTGAIGVRTVDDLVVAETMARSQIELIKSASYQTDPTLYPKVTPIPNYTVSTVVWFWNDPIFEMTPNASGLQKIEVSVSSDGNNLLQTTTYKVER